MKTLIVKTAIAAIFFCQINGCADTTTKPQVEFDKLNGFHEKYRTNVYPNHHQILLNPSAFLWPQPQHDEQPEYQVEVLDVYANIVVKSDWLKWASWRPSTPFAEGQYQWFLKKRDRFGTVSESGPFTFRVDDNIAHFAPPIQTQEQIADNLPEHPRFFGLNGSTEQFTKRIPQALQQTILTNAELFLTPESRKDHFADVNYGLKPHEIKRQKINRAKILLNHLRLKVLYLSQAYMLTKEARYAQAAREKYDFFQSIDKANITLNDFTAGMALDTALYLFDGFYDQWSEQEKAQLISFTSKIADKEFQHHQYRLESNFFDNHTWQKGIALLTRAALILGNHVPQANTWMQYVQTVWSTRAPATGFNMDGGWGNGNSYMTANIVSLIQVPMILNKLNGFDYLSHPWYQALPQAMVTTYQPLSYSNGFGDGHDSTTMPIWVRGQLAEYMARSQQNGVMTWYRDELAKGPRGKAPTEYVANSKHPLDSEAHQWLISSMEAALPKAVAPNYPNAAVFPNTGIVSMHDDIAKAAGNIHVAFRSSPFGTGSHTTNNQNAFNVIVNGEPLFLSSGYYTSFSDKHNLLHYRHTRGHNSVLVNGLGQDIGMHAVGEIKRFAHSDSISYTMGEASSAYQGRLEDPMWIKKMAESEVEFSIANGYGKSPLTTFERHLIKLDNGVIISLDELAASEPSEFSWLLHTPGQFSQQQDYLQAQVNSASAKVYLTASTPLAMTITDKYHAPAVNWSGKKKDGKLVTYKPQQHFTGTTSKANKVYILAMINVATTTRNGVEIINIEPDHWQIGNYQLHVNLDENKALYLQLENASGDKLTLKDKQYELLNQHKQIAINTYKQHHTL
ncbi:DUF4962 domain-containing protein [Paraferrimonas sp. SM1919]|uniref:DUF4962 domain-containing protein n=1 Tax=Paraferrimonas sp. SM1919 TaxID=2662263 RepID=UPI0013D6EDBF|nr:DUF4962 domain-containing protein [Paraferrimonas sp. SM1919]